MLTEEEWKEIYIFLEDNFLINSSDMQIFQERPKDQIWLEANLKIKSCQFSLHQEKRMELKSLAPSLSQGMAASLPLISEPSHSRTGSGAHTKEKEEIKFIIKEIELKIGQREQKSMDLDFTLSTVTIILNKFTNSHLHTFQICRTHPPPESESKDKPKSKSKHKHKHKSKHKSKFKSKHKDKSKRKHEEIEIRIESEEDLFEKREYLGVQNEWDSCDSQSISQRSNNLLSPNRSQFAHNLLEGGSESAWSTQKKQDEHDNLLSRRSQFAKSVNRFHFGDTLQTHQDYFVNPAQDQDNLIHLWVSLSHPHKDVDTQLILNIVIICSFIYQFRIPFKSTLKINF